MDFIGAELARPSYVRHCQFATWTICLRRNQAELASHSRLAVLIWLVEVCRVGTSNLARSMHGSWRLASGTEHARVWPFGGTLWWQLSLICVSKSQLPVWVSRYVAFASKQPVKMAPTAAKADRAAIAAIESSRLVR